MQKCILHKKSLPVFILIFFLNFANADVRRTDSSYAFLNVRSRYTPEEGVRFCVNHQQYQTLSLPETPDEAAPLRLAWWNNRLRELNICETGSRIYDANQIVPALYETNRTACGNISTAAKTMKSHSVAQALWLVHKGAPSVYGFREYLFTRFSNPDLDKVPSTSFYIYHDVFTRDVFPKIYNHEWKLDSSTNKSLVMENFEHHAELRFYRPIRAFPMDSGVFIIAALAIGSVLLGSTWAAYDTWAELNVVSSARRLRDESDAAIDESPPQRSASGGNELDEVGGENSTSGLVIVIGDENANGAAPTGAIANVAEVTGNARESAGAESNEAKPESKKRKEQRKTEAAVALADMNWAGHCCGAFCFVLFVTTTLALAYFFREYAIYIFDGVVYLMGIFCVYKVVYTIFQIIFSQNRAHGGGDFDVELFSLGQIFCLHASASTVTNPNNERRRSYSLSKRLMNLDMCKQPIYLLSLLVFCGSTAFCSTWLYMWLGDHPYAFIMLDIINVCFCAVAIRDSTFRSMRLIALLMSALFFYDMFMVFGTKIFTGCSVMIQVVTGLDCRKTDTNETYIPVAPIDVNMPKKIPIVFYVPYINDPTRECYDMVVERGFQFMILGLGDVIIPGFLVAYAFYIDVAKRNRCYSFGLVASLGYCVGLMMAFTALHIMKMGQPALIYLVPCTLIPVLIMSWRNGILKEVWRGGDLTGSQRTITNGSSSVQESRA